MLIFTIFSAKEEDKLGDLTKKNEEINKDKTKISDKTTNITRIIKKMQDSIIQSRKKRNLRKLRSHKKRQVEDSGKLISRFSDNNENF